MFRFILGLILLVAALASQAEAKGWYAGSYGGVNWNDVQYESKWLKVDDNTGYVIGLNVGTTIDSIPGLRVEGDFSYRNNGVDITLCHGALEAQDSVWGLLANLVYDVPVVIGPVHPYILGGIGYASRTGTVQDYGLEISNSGLAWELGAGINTKVADDIVVGIGYRHFQAPDLVYDPVHAEGGNDSVVVTAGFMFN